MNARTHTWGTWILSTLFLIWVAGCWAFSSMLILTIGIGAALSPYPMVWLLGAYYATFVLPPCVAILGLHLWVATPRPWLALLPALVAVATMWFAGSFAFRWGW